MSELERNRLRNAERSVEDLLEANRSASGTVLLEMLNVSIGTTQRSLVDDFSIRVREGRVTALVGASGSGKSLSARAMMGVLDVDPGLSAGTLRYPARSPRDWFEDVRGRGMAAQRALLLASESLRGGYVTYSPQSASSALNPGRTVGRQLEMAIRRRETPPADGMATAVAQVLDEVGLPHRASRALVGELSGGQAQRAALAIAIAPNPAIMIADEPETGLDPVLRRVVTELMINVARRHNVGLVLITHNKDTVDRIADDMVLIGEDPWARYR